ncbi:DUF4199 family protein [Puia dinghuensis]|uniref:DUF4199 domain-containing protein n=1 Tax=Puia dinghuensis TaxID=1792502 RepID=A0A8J2XR88_9BACT|nr:DUF4199 family protein [Puia dinghuensis]GGA85931.1 hypothetical protein GCM10011511_06240 [Puia dinghuensis]
MAAAKKIPVTLLYGSLAALGMIGVTVITYLNGTQAFIGGAAYLMYVFPVVLAIVAALAQKRRKGGILGFRDALKACFGVIVLSLAVQTVFTLILVKWIDPRFGRALPDAVLTKMESTYRRFHVPEDEIASSLAEQKKSDPFSVGPMLWGLALKYIIGFPVAVLFAAIIGQRLVNRSPKA